MKPDQNSEMTFEGYLNSCDPKARAILQEIRKLVHEAVPGCEEKISYQMPTFFKKGVILHMAAWKTHIGIYPTPQAGEEFNEELSHYKTGKGSVQFPLDKPIPYDLIRRMALFKARENEGKKK